MDFWEPKSTSSSWATKKYPGCLGYIGDDILPSFIGIIINDYKDLYRRTSTMESKRVFFHGSLEILLLEKIPNNHLGCIKPCKLWDKLPSEKLVQEFFHQQYNTLQHTWYFRSPAILVMFLPFSRCFAGQNRNWNHQYTSGQFIATEEKTSTLRWWA